MATRADAPFSPAESLSAIVQEEIRACRSILAATEAFEAALDPVDFGSLEAAVAARGHGMSRLEELEARALGLRGQAFAPPADLAEGLTLLRDLTARIREADARAREATQGAAHALRHGLRVVSHGQQVLRGYRAPADARPRFADKKG
ncbi:MAG: hypothetical protein IH608_11290 [Proteobacteria bacterium]|nr:hypothetical protein [Pseudomonadota bacterium]